MKTCREDACERRILAAQLACEAARVAMYESGRTHLMADVRTAKQRANPAERTAYLQAKDHLRQISRLR